MSEKETILVTGATGAEGGGVVRHLLKAGKFNVRCLTRNPESEKARALQTEGAEIVRGDLDKPESLASAMKDCYGVFGVTNFWDHFEKESFHGKNLIDAVKESGIRHFVFSTLPYAHKLSEWKLEVPPFDLKARMEDYARSLKLPATYAHVAFYYENFLNFFSPKLQEDGSFMFGFPQGETSLAAVAVDDIGAVIAMIFSPTGRIPRQDRWYCRGRPALQPVCRNHVPSGRQENHLPLYPAGNFCQAGLSRSGRPGQHIRVQPPLHSKPPGRPRTIPVALPGLKALRVLGRGQQR